jgi:hypothetical protein
VVHLYLDKKQGLGVELHGAKLGGGGGVEGLASVMSSGRNS